MDQMSLFNDNEIPVTKTLREKRNDKIREEYSKMTKEKHLDANYVVKQLSDKYFLLEDTIWRIIWKQGHYQ